MKSFKYYISEITTPNLSGINYISNKLNQLRDNIIDREVFIDSFVRPISTIIRRKYNATIVVNNHNEIPENLLSIHAEYDDQDDEIFITFLKHPNTKTLKYDNNSFTDFLNELIDAIEHELTHQAQSIKRDFEEPAGSSKSYYNRPDEVDAYARDIAKELRRNYISIGQIPFNKPETIRSKTLNTILDNYDKYNITANRKVLLKRVIKYLELL